MTLLADSFLPYLSYLIYGQILLIALAILVGGFLILRRLVRKQPADGGLILEKERLAAEIDEEVRRLSDLRDRLDSSFKGRSEAIGDLAVSPISSPFAKEPSVEPAAGATVAAPVINGLSDEEANKRVDAATRPLHEEIASLHEKLALASAAQSPAPTQELDAMKKNYDSKLEDLNKRLAEYTAFEDELAMVKQLKGENQELRKQLQVAATGVDLNEDDIAGLFAEMGETGEAPVEARGSGIDAATTSDPDIFKEAPLEEETTSAEGEGPSIDDLLAGMGGGIEQSAPQEEAPVELSEQKSDFEAEKLHAEPGVREDINEETAEALAELGGDDELMAEFEKVLGSAKEGA